jgi:endonuclease G
MISPELLLTNWHVFKTRDMAEKSIAEFDYTYDARGEPAPSYRFRLDPQRFFISDSELDFALVAVKTEKGNPELERRMR